MNNKLEKLLKFESIFEQKRWTQINGYDEKLDRFGSLIDVLKEEEINLIIELTHMFQWMSYNDYHNNLRMLLKQVLKESLKNKNQLILFPIIKPTDEDKLKSGHVVMKMIESIKPSISGFKNVRLKLFSEFKDIKSDNFQMGKSDYFILVDDYIGSGKTLTKTLSKINENGSIRNNYGVLAIAIQKQAKQLFEEKGITIYNSMILKKGISDTYISPELEKKIEIMQKIENKIPKVSKYRFGYEKSEALISLMKTPNNTFPVFWKGLINKGEEIEAPFQRY
ncbi:hypothetical protein LA303_07775 [Candidatus Sulfidibacterium hydrothermale]|uniref:phosphoribosyltransferase-like protein n=1 Tax=Candidatus Sulfidibacterium hydrothermale TaxID=2875962 RepID=UPI001F0A1080|nr:hypothetical protein [Candidatus Sulfidibacterium hydrothermale]UBM61321.1 hypothetical protein LA303_07775 [Candidatus Sulfidibacterium hydrothermale]